MTTVFRRLPVCKSSAVLPPRPHSRSRQKEPLPGALAPCAMLNALPYGANCHSAGSLRATGHGLLPALSANARWLRARPASEHAKKAITFTLHDGQYEGRK